MSEVDWDAEDRSTKVLLVIFIISISLTSIALIVKLLIRLFNQFTVYRLMILIITHCLLLFALFYLVVSALEQFAEYKRPIVSCNTLFASTIYGKSFLPFLYPAALICILFEIYQRALDVYEPSRTCSFVYIIIPWIITFVVVLPLTLVGVSNEYCILVFNLTISRNRALVYVCMLVPSLIAGIGSVIMSFSARINLALRESAIVNCDPIIVSAYRQNTDSVSQVHFSQPRHQPMNPHQQKHWTEQQQPFAQTQHTYGATNVAVSEPLYPQSTFVSTPDQRAVDRLQQPPSHPYPNTQTNPSTGGTSDGYVRNNNQPFHVEHNPDYYLSLHRSQIKREFKAVRMASITCCVLTLPWCIYILAYQLNENAHRIELSEAVVQNLLMWIDTLKWVVINLVWIKCV